VHNPEAAEPKVRDEDLPALFRAADRASAVGQRRYLWLIRLNLALMVLGALVTSVSIVTVRPVQALAGAAVLSAGIVLSLITRTTAFHKEWYGGRAIAESVKTLAWRYMMRAEPYAGEAHSAPADASFIERLRDILQQRRWLGAALVDLDGSADQITDRMRAVRSQPLEARKTTYLRERVEDQQQWYAQKAASNRRTATRWFALLVLCQVCAVAAAVLVVWQPRVNLAAIFAAGAAAIVAWMQVKQYEDLAQAYGLTSNELSFLRSRYDAITSDEELSTFVIDVENAISKEHTLWVARRGTD
jgi:hypothetical protein